MIEHGFVMTCHRCQRAEFAGPTAYYREAGIERVAYMIPDAPCADWTLCVGTSAGSGDTFECRVCHPFPARRSA